MHYRPSWLLLWNCILVCGLLEEVAVLERPLLIKNVGCLGVWRDKVSLSSIVTTFDMVGRSPGSSCTHKSPMFTHLMNWFVLQLSRRDGSIKSNSLFSVHSLHAWFDKELLVRYVIEKPKNEKSATYETYITQ